MTPRERTFTRFIRSRGMALLMAIAFILMAHSAHTHTPTHPTPPDRGLALPSPHLWLPQSTPTLWIAIATVLATAIMMVQINRRFNILHTLSVYFSALFLIMAAALPPVTTQLSSALLLTPAILTATAQLQAAYTRPQATRRVYLAFTIISAGATIDYGFLFYIPATLLALAQMRITTPRTLLAAILGLLTPWWILYGLGITTGSIHWTAIHLTLPTPQTIATLPGSWATATWIALTLLSGTALGAINFFKIYAYNARARAYNALLTTITLTTATATLIDFANATFYTLMLACCIAFQMGHTFRIYLHQRAYIIALGMLSAYTAIYLWATAT